MVSIVQTKDRVCQHLRSIGIHPKESARIASLIQRWIHNNGREWTVERLKALKQSHHEMLQSPGKYLLPSGWATRENCKGVRILKDGFFHRVLTHSRLNLKQVEGVLRIYQVITLDRASKSQKMKMEKAIEAPTLSSTDVIRSISENLIVRSTKLRDVLKIQKCGSEAKTLVEMLGSEKRSPTFNISYKGIITFKRTCDRKKAEAADWLEFFQTDQHWNTFWKRYPKECAKAFSTSPLSVSTSVYTSDKNLLGNVVILQSPGAKARWIANPALAIQAIGEPLKEKLLAFCSMYPEIKTTNQDLGHEVVVDWLKDGRNVYSFDATAFTDRFPVDLQLNLAKKLIKRGILDNFDYDALEIVSRGSWWSSDLAREVKWSIGQPLGYGPSFHLATLAHAAIIDTIDYRRNGKRTGCWQVVGDDVVICDESVATEYKETMTLLGVEINLQKSLISSKYAEFLGKLITKEGVNPSMKVKILEGSSQIIDALAFYGWNGWKHLTKSQRFQALDIFLPEHLGGKGWRIPGQSYTRFLSSVNLEKIRDLTVRKELQDFYGISVDPRSVSLAAELRSEYYSRNSLPLSLSEWGLNSDVEVKFLNESKDIPVFESEVPVRVPEDIVTSNTFSSVLDTMVRLENLTNQRLFTVDGRVNSSNPATLILNQNGYINNSEKKPSFQSDHLGVSNEKFRQNHFPRKGFFSPSFRKEAIDVASDGYLEEFILRKQAEAKRKSQEEIGKGPSTEEPGI